jgi:hypothetical protein
VRPLLLVLLVLFVVWIAVSVIGFVVEGLFWLAVVALLFALGTALLGASRRR